MPGIPRKFAANESGRPLDPMSFLFLFFSLSFSHLTGQGTRMFFSAWVAHVTNIAGNNSDDLLAKMMPL